MARSSPYTVVGRTSDGIEVLKPKMASGHLKEIRSAVKSVMADRRRASAVPISAKKTTRKK